MITVTVVFGLQGRRSSCSSSSISNSSISYSSISYSSSSTLLLLLTDLNRDLNQFDFVRKINSLSMHIMELEQDLFREEVNVPIYFAHSSEEVEEVYSSVVQSTQKSSAKSAFEAMLGSVSANGYQLVANAKQTKAIPEAQILNIQGKLGAHDDEQLPTVAIVAHYDSFGIAPALSFGGDSNGSGVAALMELARLFSRLNSNVTSSAARFKIVFVATGGGKFNYLGSKKFLEDQLDSADGGLLQESLYTICLDSLSQGDELNVHVSKPPKDGSHSAAFFQALKSSAADLYPEVEVNMVHKKINLADDMLAWEHERYSIRRLPAMTLSHHKSSKDAAHRGTILDTAATVDVAKLARNVHIIAEAIGSHLYNTTGPLFKGELVKLPHKIVINSRIKNNRLVSVSEDILGAWISHLTSQPRSSPLLSVKGTNGVVSLLEQSMNRFLKDVKVTHLVADKRDPEFVFYDQMETTVSAFSVKPAVFDLCLTVLIVAYLAVLYFSVQKFHLLYSVVAASPKVKSNAGDALSKPTLTKRNLIHSKYLCKNQVILFASHYGPVQVTLY
nr:EOG090X02MW [Eulimnadia texana]